MASSVEPLQEGEVVMDTTGKKWKLATLLSQTPTELIYEGEIIHWRIRMLRLGLRLCKNKNMSHCIGKKLISYLVVSLIKVFPAATHSRAAESKHILKLVSPD